MLLLLPVNISFVSLFNIFFNTIIACYVAILLCDRGKVIIIINNKYISSGIYIGTYINIKTTPFENKKYFFQLSTLARIYLLPPYCWPSRRFADWHCAISPNSTAPGTVAWHCDLFWPTSPWNWCPTRSTGPGHPTCSPVKEQSNCESTAEKGPRRRYPKMG